MRYNYSRINNSIKNLCNEKTTPSFVALIAELVAEYGAPNKVRFTAIVNSYRAAGVVRWSAVKGALEYVAGADNNGEQTGNYGLLKAAFDDYRASTEKALSSYREAATEQANQIKQLKKDVGATQTVEFTIKEQGKDDRKLDGHFHSKFGQLLALANARKNIFLYGPTGSGKSYICSQLADALGLPFYFVSCTAGMSEGILGGRLLPVGEGGKFEYVVSEFIKAYEEGGVFLLDELDAADPNVLLLINAALANGRMSIPNRQEKPYAVRHKDFVCIAASNTLGTGGNRQYSGRSRLDASTLDRFLVGKVNIDYDAKVEIALCPDSDLRAKLITVREAINAHRLERAMSTRFMLDAYDMKTLAGWDDGQILQAFFQGWPEDERNKVLEFCKSA